MTSDYEYATQSGLEEIDTDYSVVDVDKYTTGFIEANISRAERMVNGFCKQSFSGTIPDGVEEATLRMSKSLMHNIMIDDGYGREGAVRIKDIIDPTVEKLLADHKISEDWYVKSGSFNIDV